MNTQKIVKLFLKKKGYSGLLNRECECCCTLKDFIPCGGEDFIDCEPAYKHSFGGFSVVTDEKKQPEVCDVLEFMLKNNG